MRSIDLDAALDVRAEPCPAGRGQRQEQPQAQEAARPLHAVEVRVDSRDARGHEARRGVKGLGQQIGRAA